MPFAFTVSDIVPAKPKAVYDAWLDSKRHGAMTGSPAKIRAEVGGAFTAWDGYIRGKTLTLEPPHRIVQSWRTSKFTEADADSRIEVRFDAVAGGTRISVRHSNVPDGHTSYRDGGWQDNYFEPMKRYFAKG